LGQKTSLDNAKRHNFDRHDSMSEVQDRLVSERNVLTARLATIRRHLGKIKGKRKFPETDFILGDTWAAMSEVDSCWGMKPALEWELARMQRELDKIAEREAWNRLSPEEQRHRAIMKHGWRPMPERVTQPN
jgi:hypothetical protein